MRLASIGAVPSALATRKSDSNHCQLFILIRDRPKLEKYSDGYPGDREEMYPLVTRYRKQIRVHVRWTCHTCQKSFKDHEKICAGCGHERCNECPRYPPKKAKKEFDEEVIRSVEEKLKNISLSPQASAA